MFIVALAVASAVPVARRVASTHEASAALYRLTDLVNRERDAAWHAMTFGVAGVVPATAEPNDSHERRHEAIEDILARAADVLPAGLPETVRQFVTLTDRQLALLREGRPLAAQELERTRVQAAYTAVVDRLDEAALSADAAAETAAAWESIVLLAIALVAMVLVIGLFVVLQRRNAALEFSAGRREALESERRRLDALIAAASEFIAIMGRDGRLTWGSPSVAAALGTTEDRLPGIRALRLVHPADRRRLTALIAGMPRDGGLVRTELRVLLGRDRDDERWLELAVADGSLLPGIEGLIVNARDVTENHQAREALEARERDLRELMNHVNGVFYRAELGASGRWTFVSPQIEHLLGYTAEEWLADADLWLRSIHPYDRDRVLREEGEPTAGAVDYRMVTRRGDTRWVRDDASPVWSDERRGWYWAGTLIDVTQAYQVEEELRYRAHHDALTGLPNRSLLLDRLGNALDRSRRKPTEVGLIYLDLDDFKAVNDEHGHAAGDAVLVAVAERLRGAIRPGDTAARLGGDEFALLVDEVDRDGLSAAADRVSGALELPLDVGGRQLRVTASVGVAISAGSTTEPERLLRDADTAMYVAKREGRRRWAFFDPGMSGPQRLRVRLEGDLRRALAHEEFHLVYQPVVRLSDGRIEGAEALLRWHSPEGGVIDPAEFLDVAEEIGVMVPIGHWVLRRACQDAAMWQRYTRRGTWLGVNISARQLLDPAMVASVADALTESGLAPGRLVLEVTENAALRDIDAAERRLGELKSLGVRLAIDDFGAGTSSIGHLRRLGFDLIKIDRSLVGEVSSSTEAQDLVRSLVHISRTLRARPLAEGVESEAQAEALRAAGCELGQGYLYARPMEAVTLRDAFLPRESPAFVS